MFDARSMSPTGFLLVLLILNISTAKVTSSENRLNWKDDVRSKLTSVFKDDAETLVRILFHLDHEELRYYEYKNEPGLKASPTWQTLKYLLENDVAFDKYARRLASVSPSTTTGQQSAGENNDDEGRKFHDNNEMPHQHESEWRRHSRETVFDDHVTEDENESIRFERVEAINEWAAEMNNEDFSFGFKQERAEEEGGGEAQQAYVSTTGMRSYSASDGLRKIYDGVVTIAKAAVCFLRDSVLAVFLKFHGF